MLEFTIYTHGLKNLPNYLFSGNDLYVIENCKQNRTQRTKMLKIQTIGKQRPCKGYFIERKFRSLTSLNKRKYPLIKIELKTDKLPF